MKSFIACALAGAAYGTTTDRATALDQANQASDAMKGVSKTLTLTEDVFKVADALAPKLEILQTVDPFFAVIGYVTAFANLFKPSDTDLILAAIKDVQHEIKALESDMQYYFQKVLNAAQQDVCYSQYADHELKIKQATKKYTAYLDKKGSGLESVYRDDFMDECASSACDDASMALLGAITGQSGLFGCDLLQIFYTGDANADYYQGWRDDVTNKGSYLMSLVNLGVTAQSAYLTLLTNNQDAWQLVQDDYGDLLASGTQRILDFAQKAKDEWATNADVNVNRIAQSFSDAGASNQTMTHSLTQKMYEIFNWRLWQSQVYDNIGGSNRHYVICYECHILMHFANKYNIVVSSIAEGSKKYSLAQDWFIGSQADAKRNANDIATDIWRRHCYSGVHVIDRYVGEYTSSYYGDIQYTVVGSHHTIVTWALQGWCDTEMAQRYHQVQVTPMSEYEPVRKEATFMSS